MFLVNVKIFKGSSDVMFASRTVCSRDAAVEHTWMYLLRVQEADMISECHQKLIKPWYCKLQPMPWRRSMIDSFRYTFMLRSFRTGTS